MITLKEVLKKSNDMTPEEAHNYIEAEFEKVRELALEKWNRGRNAIIGGAEDFWSWWDKEGQIKCSFCNYFGYFRTGSCACPLAVDRCCDGNEWGKINGFYLFYPYAEEEKITQDEILSLVDKMIARIKSVNIFDFIKGMKS